MDTNYCKILTSSINGKAMGDERAFGSIEILTERLQRVKKLGKPFLSISFSPHVKKLAMRKASVAVC